MAYSILKHRRGTTQEWLNLDLIPQEGELVIEECSDGVLRCKIGNGKDAFTALDYIDDNVKRLLLAKISDVKQSIKASLVNLDNKQTKALETNYNSIKADIKSSLEDLQGYLCDYADKEAAELAETLGQEINTVREDLLLDILSNKNSLNKKIQSLEDSAANIQKDIYKYIDNKDTNLSNTLSEELVSAVANLDAKLTALISKSVSLSETSIKELNDEIDSLKVDFPASVSEAMQEAKEEAKEELNKAIKTLDEKHTSTENALEVKIDTYDTTQTQALADHISSAKKSLEQAKSDITTAYTNEIVNAKKELQEQITTVSGEKTDEIKAAELLLKALLETQKVKHIADIEALQSEISDLSSISETNLTKHIKENSDSFKALKEAIATLNKKTETLASDDLLIVNSLYEITNKLNADLISLSKEIYTVVDNSAAEIEDLQTKTSEIKESALEADLKITDTLITYVTDIYTELETLVNNDMAIINRLFTGDNTLNARVTNLEVDLRNLIEDAKTELKISLAELTSTNNLKFITVQDEIARVESLIGADNDELLANIDELSKEIGALHTALDSTLYIINSKLAMLDSRIDKNELAIQLQTNRLSKIISLESGSTTGDAELIDIRTGYNGIEHISAGEAVRAIGKDIDDLKASLPEYIPSNAVDGLIYEDNLLYLSSNGVAVSEPVEITGGSGGGSGAISTVKIENLLSSNTFTVAKDKDAIIKFKYFSYEGETPTGAGTLTLTINSTKVADYSGVSIVHGEETIIDLKDYLKTGTNTVRVTCADQYGVSRTLVYTISVIDLKITSTFDATLTYSDKFVFRYTVVGAIEKTVHILLDGVEVSTKVLSASASNIESTYIVPKQSHGSHLISAYVTAEIGEVEIPSNIINYEVICIESGNNHAVLASVFDTEEITQGDLISIPFMLYDPNKVDCSVTLNIYSQVAGKLVKYDSTELVVDRTTQYWQTRKYPAGTSIFEINYSYDLYGDTYVLTRSHTVLVNELKVDVEAATDNLQVYLSAQGRLNSEANPAIWEFESEYDESTVTTTFTDFNWKSNGWMTDENGDTCLRLNGDARATINFKPFAKDFKINGKTIEFEFKVRDVNSRDTVVIDCFEGGRGFQATPDTAYLQSSGTKVSCRYKEEEKIRIAITVDYSNSLSKFVCIYLDGVLSGVQRYADTDVFAQENAVNITLGSNLCGLDLYSVRVYDKSLETRQILYNYIADLSEPTTKQQLLTDNNILDENGKISYEKVKALGQVPIITFIGKMPEYKGDKQKKSVRMVFEDPINKDLNFDEILDQIDVQGTSSQFYVRKNWKTEHSSARQHIPGAIPAKVFCIKVDYAEATGTHNTGVANYVETFYDREEITLPPQKDDHRIRTTIQGFPCVIFEKATEDAEPVFASKGNFNYDKGAEDVFGFSETYENYGVECWEFCNNTSDAVNFVGEIPSEWIDDFEPRYVPESANFERIEELLELKEDAANNKATITNAELEELASLQQRCIANFKAMHNWVLSTATYTLEDGQRVPITPVALEEPITYGVTTYTEDNEEYRLAKFKYEFEDYFNMHYSCIYYVFTLFALMTDQRAKNMFLTRWKEDDGVYRWYPYFYDNDTIFGINNEGALVFDYYHEDIDQLGSSNVYNGQNSVLWNNFRICFPQKIQEVYAYLRSSKKLTYDAIIEQFVTNGSDKWSAAIYNEDAEYKYVSMARVESTQTDENGNNYVGVDASNLYQVRGPGEHHLRYFIDNRLMYCDSKFYAGDYPSDDIFLRIYTPKLAEVKEDMSEEEKAKTIASNERIAASLAVVPANPNITITPFSNIYAGVRYKSGILQQKRLAAGESYTFGPIDPNETFGDTETAIYGASELSSLGDLSGLYCGVISLGNASKLTEIVVGNASTDYQNDNFREISVGTNRLLKTIDLRNCSGLGIAGANPQKTLDLKGCPNIENIYTEGTNLSAVALPDSGYIKVLHLPGSINTLEIRNQQYIEDFSVADYSNIKLLNIENCALDTNQILESCRDAEDHYTVERVRLSGIDWQLEDVSFIESLYPKFDEDGNFIGGIRGIDANNNLEDEAYLAGKCHIKTLTGSEFSLIKSHYPYLKLGYDKLTSHITFMNEVGDSIIYESDVVSENSIAADYPDPVRAGLIQTPTKESTPEFEYKWLGWSRYPNNELHKDALLKIESDRVLYPVFEAIQRSYEVKFINPTDNNKELYSTMVLYGDDAEYKGEVDVKDLVKGDTNSPEDFSFSSWYPGTENITGPRTCYAQFEVDKDSWHELTVDDISNCEDKDGNLYDGYILNTSNDTMSITKNKNNFNTAVRINDTLDINNQTYTITSLGGFSNNEMITVIDLPETLLSISSDAFNCCYNLEEVYIPNSLTSIGLRAFRSCSKLDSIKITQNINSIGQEAFTLSGLKTIDIDPLNTKYLIIDNCLIDIQNNILLFGGLPDASIPQNSLISSFAPYCFHSTNIVSAQVPEGISIVSNNAFSRCYKLTEVTLPSTIKTLDATCFAWCYDLSKITLPEGLTNINTWVFYGCAFENIEIPTSVTSILERSFGSLTNLKTVTFKKKLDADGNVVIPTIHEAAFAGSGSAEGLIINIPWQVEETPLAPWGATHCTIKYYENEEDLDTNA